MLRFLNTLSRVGLLALLLGTWVSCATVQDTPTAAGGLSERERQLIRQQMTPQPLPSDPVYVRVRQSCIFCATHPEDGTMVPIGMLQPDAYVILRRNDGAWMDVQLMSGQVGSVVGSNLRAITPDEDGKQEYLEPQPDLEPLSLPQADSSPVNTVLLGS